MGNFFSSTFDEKIKNIEPVEPSPIADLCPCGSSRYWFDYFGGGPHCVACKPAPSRSMIAKLAIVDDRDDSALVDVPDAKQTEADLDREFDRNWITFEANGKVISERKGVYSRDHRFGIACLEAQERRAKEEADEEDAESDEKSADHLAASSSSPAARAAEPIRENYSPDTRDPQLPCMFC